MEKELSTEIFRLLQRDGYYLIYPISDKDFYLVEKLLSGKKYEILRGELVPRFFKVYEEFETIKD